MYVYMYIYIYTYTYIYIFISANNTLNAIFGHSLQKTARPGWRVDGPVRMMFGNSIGQISFFLMDKHCFNTFK